MGTLEGWASMLAALGVGGILLKSTEALWKWLSGRVGREVNAVARERARADSAEKRADSEQQRADDLDRKLDGEVALRRAVMNIAAKYEHQLIVLGIDTAMLQVWPEELTLPRHKLPAPSGEGQETA